MTRFICQTCGGALVPAGDGLLECKYCKNLYREDKARETEEVLRSILAYHNYLPRY